MPTFIKTLINCPECGVIAVDGIVKSLKCPRCGKWLMVFGHILRYNRIGKLVETSINGGKVRNRLYPFLQETAIQN